ncbi:hypothetical protein Airi01_030930 [Actinoallomurus iriomotensis]|uniref:Uncharacterized protein n=1 Tax=Actinoallomurus iriomotensis TaxID=478107 RepID=A0A9W6VQN9_9ACTN|nr:hypothetical protein Airi01_030930 [Actinoallomurus iriomotensis]
MLLTRRSRNAAPTTVTHSDISDFISSPPCFLNTNPLLTECNMAREEIANLLMDVVGGLAGGSSGHTFSDTGNLKGSAI